MARRTKTVLWAGLLCALVFSLVWFVWWARTDTGMPADRLESAAGSGTGNMEASKEAAIGKGSTQVSPSHRSLTVDGAASGDPEQGGSLPDWWAGAVQSDDGSGSFSAGRSTEGQQADRPRNREELEELVKQHLIEQGRYDIVERLETRAAQRQEKGAVREEYSEIRNELMNERRELRELLREMKGTEMEDDIRQQLEWNRQEMSSQQKALKGVIDTMEAPEGNGDRS